MEFKYFGIHSIFLSVISGLIGLGASPAWGHCVVFLGKTLYYPSAPLHPDE